MSNSSAPQQTQPLDKQSEPEKVNGSRVIGAAGLTTLPDKRPSRRFFGLLPGRRSS